MKLELFKVTLLCAMAFSQTFIGLLNVTVALEPQYDPIITPVDWLAQEVFANASAWNFFAYTKYVKDSEVYWMPFGFFHPWKWTGYSLSLESEAAAQNLIGLVWLYNSTRAPVYLALAKRTANVIVGILQEHGTRLNCYGGLWEKWNNITKQPASPHRMASSHSFMALIGMSFLYNITGNAMYKSSSEELKRFLNDFMWNSIRENYYDRWDNDTQSYTPSDPGPFWDNFWAIGGNSAYCLWIQDNSTLRYRINLMYNKAMTEDIDYKTIFESFDIDIEQHNYNGWGQRLAYELTKNSTYLEVFNNTTRWNIKLIDANPQGANGSLPYRFDRNPVPTWSTIPAFAGTKPWAEIQALFHMVQMYGYERNSTFVTYMNIVFNHLKEIGDPNGFWFYTRNHGTDSTDNRTWSAASLWMCMAVATYYKYVSEPTYPYIVFSDIQASSFVWDNDREQLLISLVDEWSRYSELGGSHRVVFKCELAPKRIYVDGKELIETNWSYSNKILDLNFTSQTKSQVIIYFSESELSKPHLAYSSCNTSDLAFIEAEKKLRWKAHGYKRKSAVLGGNLFFDDFSAYSPGSDGTPTWTIVEDSDWEVTLEQWYRRYNLSWGISVAGEETWTDYTVEVDVYVEVPGAWGTQLLFRYQNPQNYYAVILQSRGGETYKGLHFVQRKMDKEYGHIFIPYEVCGLPDGEKWYHVKIETVKNHITVSVNETKYFEHYDTLFPLLEGKVGFRNYGSKQHFDNVNVTKIEYVPAPWDAQFKINCLTYGSPFPSSLSNASWKSFEGTVLTIVSNFSSSVDIEIQFPKRVFVQQSSHKITSLTEARFGLNATVPASIGENVTLEIYNRYDKELWDVTSTESKWGYHWNSTSNILTVWAISDGEVEILVYEIREYTLSVNTFRNGVAILSNITLFDQNRTILETVQDVTFSEWFLLPGTYFTEATTYYNEYTYRSAQMRVDLKPYGRNITLAIDFLFSNLTVSCRDVNDSPLEGCAVIFTSGVETHTQYTDQSGSTTLEAYYGYWIITAHWMNIPVGMMFAHVNETKVKISLNCSVGDLVVVVVDQFGRPIKSTITLTNSEYNLILSDHLDGTTNSLTFQQIPLVLYTLKIEGESGTKTYFINVMRTRQIRIEIEQFGWTEKIGYIVIGAIVGSAATYLVRWLITKRRRRKINLSSSNVY